jgi:phospholipase/carboxylesterase
LDVLLPAIEVETAANPQFSVIWLHGLGADGADFVPVVAQLGLAAGRAVRFIFPHAPAIAVTCNGGYVMPAWYDIVSLGGNSRSVDDAGIAASRQAIADLIARENRRGIPSQRIFIAGFSQGGAIAYVTALSYPEKLAGVIALSTYLPLPGLLASEASAANRALPIFAAHGTADEVVSFELGVAARALLVDHGYAPEWHDYPIAHSVCLDEIRAIGKWLNGLMARCVS